MKRPDDKQETHMNTIEKAMRRFKTSSGQEKEDTPHVVKIMSTQQVTPREAVSSLESDVKVTPPATIGGSVTTNFCDLDFIELNRKGFLTPDIPNESLREEYRVVKRPLLNNARGKSAVPVPLGNVIMMTSAMPGEGKTYNSLNLAISFAMERDTHVLLIDSDVIKPSLTRIVGLPDVPGLTDLLSGEIDDISEIFYKTNMPKLTIIPAGRRHAQDTELLSSNKMKRLTEELAARYPDRIILFDAPPMLATSHARVLIQYAGQIVLVVEAGKTLEHSIKDAVSQIGDDKVVGVVLNKGRGASGSSYYGSYGTYGSDADSNE